MKTTDSYQRKTGHWTGSLLRTGQAFWLVLMVGAATLLASQTADASVIMEVRRINPFAASPWRTDGLTTEYEPRLELRLKITNKSGDTVDYHFYGPPSNEHWQIVYRLQGQGNTWTEVDPVGLNLTLSKNESKVMAIFIDIGDAPAAYLMDYLRVYDTNDGNKLVGEVFLNVTRAGNLMIQREGDTGWVGENELYFDSDPASTPQAISHQVGLRQSAIYNLRLQNVQNAVVSYRLRMDQFVGDDVQALVRFSTSDGTDITDAMRDSAGYATGSIAAGSHLDIQMRLTPVGVQPRQWNTVFSVKIESIDSPAIAIDPTSMKHFDAVRCTTSFDVEGVRPRLMQSGWKRGRPE